MKSSRILFFLAGSLSLGLGALGVVLPVLPTTPFLILAAYCFARSSERAHAWLMNNRVFGPLLRDYLEGRGVSWRIKAGALVFLWAVIGVSIALFVPFLWARIALGVIAVAVTVHIIMIKGRRRS
jgi:uncharacterized protein